MSNTGRKQAKATRQWRVCRRVMLGCLSAAQSVLKILTESDMSALAVSNLFPEVTTETTGKLTPGLSIFPSSFREKLCLQSTQDLILSNEGHSVEVKKRLVKLSYTIQCQEKKNLETETLAAIPNPVFVELQGTTFRNSAVAELALLAVNLTKDMDREGDRALRTVRRHGEAYIAAAELWKAGRAAVFTAVDTRAAAARTAEEGRRAAAGAPTVAELAAEDLAYANAYVLRPGDFAGAGCLWSRFTDRMTNLPATNLDEG